MKPSNSDGLVDDGAEDSPLLNAAASHPPVSLFTLSDSFDIWNTTSFNRGTTRQPSTCASSTVSIAEERRRSFVHQFTDHQGVVVGICGGMDKRRLGNDIGAQEHILENDLQPMPTPTAAFGKLGARLQNDEDWSDQFQALTDLRRVTKFSPEVAYGSTTSKKGMTLLDLADQLEHLASSPRSSLQKNAIVCIQEIFTRNPAPTSDATFIEKLLTTCLRQASATGKVSSINEQADIATEKICSTALPSKVTPVVSRLLHENKNAHRLRGKCVICWGIVVSRLGEFILVNKEFKQNLKTIIQMTTSASLESRCSSRITCALILRHLPNSCIALKAVITEAEIQQLKAEASRVAGEPTLSLSQDLGIAAPPTTPTGHPDSRGETPSQGIVNRRRTGGPAVRDAGTRSPDSRYGGCRPPTASRAPRPPPVLPCGGYYTPIPRCVSTGDRRPTAQAQLSDGSSSLSSLSAYGDFHQPSHSARSRLRNVEEPGGNGSPRLRARNRACTMVHRPPPSPSFQARAGPMPPALPRGLRGRKRSVDTEVLSPFAGPSTVEWGVVNFSLQRSVTPLPTTMPPRSPHGARLGFEARSASRARRPSVVVGGGIEYDGGDRIPKPDTVLL